ncbi:MAG: FliA/WhiG family RNA polymerase sigma factor [Planctomycetota bacterium]
MTKKKPVERTKETATKAAPKSAHEPRESKAHASDAEPKAPLPSAAARPRIEIKKVDAPELEPLPTEEIWEVYRKARKAKNEVEIEKLRNVLMERHYPLVRYIAERLLQTLPKSIELDDLVSAGLFGLMDAIRGFDPDRNIKFKTYCTTRIRGSILDQLRSQDWVPRLVRLKAGRIDKTLQRLTGEYGREPTHAELAAALQMDHTELTTEMNSASAKTMFSLSEKWEDRDDDSSIEKVDILEDRRAIDPIGELHRRDMMDFITRSLTHKERFIITQYYQVGHTMREIGEMLELTESRVCQIHSNVMSRLKGLLGQKSGTLLM